MLHEKSQDTAKEMAAESGALATPQRSTHLYEQIHKIMWDKILSGEIVPGQRLKDVEWASILGVSRTPVREAMRKMEQERVLLPLANGGYQVRSVSSNDLEELYRCRAALESLAVREAAKSFTPKQAKQFDLLVHQVDGAIADGDLDKVFSLNTEFHWLIVQSSNNSHLINLCAALKKLVTFYRSARLNRGRAGEQDKEEYLAHLRSEQADHRAIVDALRERDGDQAAALMEKHLLNIASYQGISS